MAKTRKTTSADSYRSVGVTSDGVRILKPKTKPTHFTAAEIRTTIRKVLRDQDAQGAPSKKGDIYVEPRPSGDFAVKRQYAKRASAVTPTQKEAIERAQELAPDKSPVVRRVRATSGGAKGQWRKA